MSKLEEIRYSAGNSSNKKPQIFRNSVVDDLKFFRARTK